MATATKDPIDLPVNLRLSREAQRKLAERAALSGRPLADYLSEVVEQAITQPTADELLAPFREQVAQSGASDEELDAFYEDLRNKVWEAQQGRKG
jgi:predicted DNA-binding protein